MRNVQVKPAQTMYGGLSEAEKQRPAESGGSGCWSCLCPQASQGGSESEQAQFVKKSQTARDLKNSFCEHTWDIHRIAANHSDSHIDTRHPAKSGGLSAARAQQLLQQNGPNELPKPKEMSNLELFLRQFWNMLWIMLMGAASLSLVQFFLNTSNLVNLWITLIVYGMIVAMCTMSWYEEMNARRVVSSFQNLLPKFCTAIRDGKDQYIGAEHLVVGDIIRIKNGGRIAADARILQCNQLKLESSSITGEAEPIDHKAEEVAENVSVFDAHNVALNGSLCVDGEGIAIVIKTATDTAIGQIAEMTTSQGLKKSRLELQIRKYVVFLLVLACSIATVVFVIGGFVHRWHNVINLISNGFLVCVIGLVPCGLPATVTSMLSLIAKRMASRQVYLKRLDICEALGQVGIIASDKTGTLTKNQMTVTCLWFHDRINKGPPERQSGGSFAKPVLGMLQCMGVGHEMPKHNGQTAIGMEPEKKETSPGSPSELAMVRYSQTNFDSSQLPPVVFEVPFNSRRKWQLSILRVGEETDGECEYRILMKGASEILAKLCARVLTEEGSERMLGAEEMDAFETAYRTFAEDGLRVIGFATATFRAPADIKFSLEEENFPIKGLTFLGVCGIEDPPKDESAESVRLCKQAGIKVFMVTGDHQLTATAIAKQIGLIDPNSRALSGPDHEVIHGDQIKALSEHQWDTILAKSSLVFARTTPEQKLFIVEQCQKRRQLIAMTGDGVNDAPALKKADIGIAMGSGSEVAKQASDIILMDDNFSSIVRAVKEGRVMYENIKKLLAYTMPHSFPQVWPIIVNFCLGMPQGITALQILFIDLGTELLPGISMVKEPPEKDVMHKPPRPMDKVLVSNQLLSYAYLCIGQIQALGCFLAYLYVFHSHGIDVRDLWMSDDDYWQKGSHVFHSNGHNFTWEQQLYIQSQACSAWQMGNVFGQWWNVWNAKAPQFSLFTTFGYVFWNNKIMLVALAAELTLILCYVYLPGLNTFMGGAPIPWQCWAIVAVLGVATIVYNEIRKCIVRCCPRSTLANMLRY